METVPLLALGVLTEACSSVGVERFPLFSLINMVCTNISKCFDDTTTVTFILRLASILELKHMTVLCVGLEAL